MSDYPERTLYEAVEWIVGEGKGFTEREVERERQEALTDYRARVAECIERREPHGLIMAENQMLDSSKLGKKFLVPFGGKSSLEKVPEGPFSIDGTASGTVCVVGVVKLNKEER